MVRKLLELLTTTSFGPLLINGDAGGTITAEGVSHLCQKQDINTLIHLGNTGMNADCLLTTTTCKIPSGPLIAPCSQGAVERKRGGGHGPLSKACRSCEARREENKASAGRIPLFGECTRC